MFRAFSNVLKLEDVMIKPVTAIESATEWREIYVKMENKPAALLLLESTEVWQVIQSCPII